LKYKLHPFFVVADFLRRSDADLQEHLGGAVVFLGKRLTTGKQIRLALEYELSLGHETIPLCPREECPGFSDTTGCPGHEIEEGMAC
jgi:hypothetical protein